MTGPRARGLGELVPDNVVDKMFLTAAGTSPWTVHAEVAAPSRLEHSQLIGAALRTMREHPLLGARRDPCGRGWRLSTAPVPPPVSLDEVPDEHIERHRAQLVSSGFDLQRESPVRFHHVRTPQATHLLAVCDHALVDGVAVGEVMRSWIGHHLGGVDTAPDETWREAHALALPRPPAARVRTVVAGMRASVLPVPVRVARRSMTGARGYGVGRRRFDDQVQGLLAEPPTTSATPNDALVAALCLAVGAWNRRHGEPALPVTIGVPLNLRPVRHWRRGVCNATMPWPVRVDAERPDAVLDQVSSQLRAVRLAAFSPEVRSLVNHLVDRGNLPLWVRHALGSMTTMLSTVPGAELEWLDSAGEERLVPIDGGSPAPASMGVTFAAMLGASGVRITARYLRAQHDAEGIDELLAGVERGVVRLYGG